MRIVAVLAAAEDDRPVAERVAPCPCSGRSGRCGPGRRSGSRGANRVERGGPERLDRVVGGGVFRGHRLGPDSGGNGHGRDPQSRGGSESRASGVPGEANAPGGEASATVTARRTARKTGWQSDRPAAPGEESCRGSPRRSAFAWWGAMAARSGRADRHPSGRLASAPDGR